MIGCGNHVVKNILRCFPETGPRRIVSIYVRRAKHYRAAHPALADVFTDDLDALLVNPRVDVVYVATPISTHFDYASAALNAGKHVWCEKPLTDTLDHTRALVELAETRGLLIGEMAMYRSHAQFSWVRGLIADKAAAGERLIGARARFSIPELPPTDIRYRCDLAGGALLDVGYYPLSAGVALFGPPRAVLAVGHVSHDFGVDLSGQALLAYDGFSWSATWAIGASYVNEMELSFERSTYVVPRAFAKPADLATQVRVIGPFGQDEPPVYIAPDDQFERLFQKFADAIQAGDRDAFRRMGQEAAATAEVLQTIHNTIHATAGEQH